MNEGEDESVGAVFAVIGEEEEVVVGSAGFGLSGVLKGDLKGFERVFVAVFNRRRLEGWMGDMMRGCGRECTRYPTYRWMLCWSEWIW